MPFEANKSCVTLNTNQNTTDWAINTTAEPISVVTYSYSAFLLYNEWQITEDKTPIIYYQFCGPFIVLLRSFAKHINYNVVFQPGRVPIDVQGVLQSLVNVNLDRIPQLILFPFHAYMIDQFAELNISYTASRYIGGRGGLVLLSRTKLIDRPSFAFLDCWDHSIYLLLFLSILVIGLVYGIIERSFGSIFEAMWDYSSVLLSDSFAIRLKSDKTRLLAIIWLLVNTILLSIFSGELYELIIRGPIIDRIEDIEDVLTKENWKDSTLLSIDEALFEYSGQDYVINNELSNELLEGMGYLDIMGFYFNVTVKRIVFESMLQDNSIIAGNKLATYLFLRRIQSMFPLIKDNYKEGLDYYISKPKSDNNCYYLMYDFNDFPYPHTFNIIISHLQESGIYEYEVQKVGRPKGYGPDPDTEPEVLLEDVLKPMGFVELKGCYLLLIWGLISSIIFYFIEIIFHFLYDCIISSRTN